MIKAVIFDMDGVLIDSEPIHIRAKREVFKSFGIDISVQELQQYAGRSAGFFWRLFKGKYNLSESAEKLAETKRKRFLEILKEQKHIMPIEGIPEFLKNLKDNNLKLAVASSSPIDLVEYITGMLKINRNFDTLVSGDFVKESKPEPDIFLYAADKLGVNPEECVVIEDSASGVIAAKRAGMKCIGYKNINSGNQDLSLADKIIDSFKDISAEDIE